MNLSIKYIYKQYLSESYFLIDTYAKSYLHYRLDPEYSIIDEEALDIVYNHSTKKIKSLIKLAIDTSTKTPRRRYTTLCLLMAYTVYKYNE